jgi:uncharacterized membrane protein (DUF485 family)
MTEKKSKKKKEFDYLFFVKLIEKILGSIRKLLTLKLLGFFNKWLTILGNYSLLIASVLALLIGIVGAIRLESFMFFLTALVFSIFVLVIQYIANKFSHAGEMLIKNNPTSLSSTAFLDSLGLLAMIGGIVALLVNLYFAIKSPSLNALLTGVGLFVFLEFVALIALNPELITVDVVKETTAGEEAIGILTFFIKKIMKLVPILFGLGVIIGTVMLLVSSFNLFSNERMLFAPAKIEWSYSLIISSGLLPLLSYILFVLFYLTIDIIRAILSLPRKIDNLRK